MAERGVCCCFWLAWVAQLRATDIVLGLLRLSKHSNCMAGLPVQYDCGQTEIIMRARSFSEQLRLEACAAIEQLRVAVDREMPARMLFVGSSSRI